MRKKFFLLVMVFSFSILVMELNAQEICSNRTGVIGVFEYELWIHDGEACVNWDDGAFQIFWGDMTMVDFWMGIGSSNGDEQIHYTIDFQPDGNAWYGAYGRVLEYEKIDSYAEYDEFYVIDGWGLWKPTMGNKIIGTVNSDGESYDIYYYETSRHGTFFTLYFNQYWIVNRRERGDGIVSVANHIEEIGNLGFNESQNELDFVGFTVSAYQSKGAANVNELEIYSSGPTPEITARPGKMGDVDSNGKVDIVDALLVAQFYVGMKLDLFEVNNGDVNSDGTINIVDSLRIAQCYVGLTGCDF